MDTARRYRTERRLAAILAADVAGYSRLIGADEEGTLHRFKAIRTEVIDPVIAAHRGRLVKTTGDGLLVEFASVVDALRCAVEVQQEIAGRDTEAPADQRIEFRIGIHQGDIVVEDDDIFGDGVNVAARLEAMAEPGGICISARVQEDAAGRLDLDFVDLGEQRLKNIARAIRVYRVGAHNPAAQPAQARLPLPDKPSIAVLPFQNISGNPEQEVFADGMVEDITTALSKLRWFFVIARNSSFAYKGRAVDVKRVGREFGVRYVLEGSVRKAGSRLRVNAQLVEAESGSHVWAERYDRDLSDIFMVQDEITERVVAAIEPQLYAAEHFRSRRKAPEHLDAWECVIQALSRMEQGTIAGTEAAEKLYRRAINLAPQYAQAHSLLAWSLMLRAIIGGGVTEMVPRAMSEVQAAIALDEQDPWAHLVLGMLHWRLRRYPEAESALLRAVTLNPNFAVAHAALGFPLALQGRADPAISSIEHALRLNPVDIFLGYFATSAMTVAHFAAGRYAEAVTWTRKTIERRPEYPRSYALLMAAAAMNGDFAAAVEALGVHSRLVPHHSLAWERENMPFAGEFAERFLEGLRRAGVPEE